MRLRVLSSLPFVGDRFANLKRFDYQPVGTLRRVRNAVRECGA